VIAVFCVSETAMKIVRGLVGCPGGVIIRYAAGIQAAPSVENCFGKIMTRLATSSVMAGG
jgi:hypothetical protein